MSAQTWLIQAAGWTFPLLVLAAVIYLVRLDRNPRVKFKLYDFITDIDGTGNSGSLAYTGIFMVSSWLVWFLAVSKQWGESVALVGSLGGIFVLGGAVRQWTGSRERVGLAKARQPKRDPSEVKTTTTTTTEAPE